MKRVFFSIIVALGFFVWGTPPTTANAQVKTSPAPTFPKVPEFKAKTWLQGQATTLSNKDTIYILELWATWCGPCEESLPGLAALQKQHPTQKLRAVALTGDDLKAVRKFLKNHRMLAPLSVAVDTQSYQQISEHFGVNGIPTALMIQNGRLLWKGHPADMEPVLAMALKGRWTPGALVRSKQLKLDAVAFEKYWRGGGQLTPEAQTQGKRLVQNGQDHPMVLNNVAWVMLTETPKGKRPLTLALSIAKAANSAAESKDFNVLDTYARALYLTGDTKQASALQSKALRLCQASRGNCADLRSILKIYQAKGTLEP